MGSFFMENELCWGSTIYTCNPFKFRDWVIRGISTTAAVKPRVTEQTWSSVCGECRPCSMGTNLRMLLGFALLWNIETKSQLTVTTTVLCLWGVIAPAWWCLSFGCTLEGASWSQSQPHPPALSVCTAPRASRGRWKGRGTKGLGAQQGLAPLPGKENWAIFNDSSLLLFLFSFFFFSLCSQTACLMKQSILRGVFLCGKAKKKKQQEFHLKSEGHCQRAPVQLVSEHMYVLQEHQVCRGESVAIPPVGRSTCFMATCAEWGREAFSCLASRHARGPACTHACSRGLFPVS